MATNSCSGSDKACAAARLIIMTGYTPDYAAHAKLLAEYKGLRLVITLSKAIELSALRAILAGESRQTTQ